MAHSQALHQQRMADNQARFQAHQQMMQERYDASDRQHRQWMNDFRSSGSSAYAGSDYTGHEAFIDGIHERSTFDDPYSGQQVQHEGQYDHWYTNGLGDYYGTDDPAHASGIVTFEHPDPGGLFAHLGERRIQASVRNRMLRFAPTYYNTPDEVAAVLEAVAAYGTVRA